MPLIVTGGDQVFFYLFFVVENGNKNNLEGVSFWKYGFCSDGQCRVPVTLNNPHLTACLSLLSCLYLSVISSGCLENHGAY